MSLSFAEPVQLQDVRLLDLAGTELGVGTIDEAAARQVSIPVEAGSTGARILSWTAIANDGTKLPQSIAFVVGNAPSARLDVSQAASAASGSELARSVALVSLMAMLLAIAVAAQRRWRLRHSGAGRTVVPWSAVLVACAAGLALGGINGLTAIVRHSIALTSDGSIEAITSSTFGAWMLAAIALAIVVAVVIATGAGRARAALLSGCLVVAAAVLLAGIGGLETLTAPDEYVEERLALEGDVQLSARVEPGAVGTNELTIDVGIPDDAATGDAGGEPVLTLRPLAGGIGPIRVRLEAHSDGGLGADDVLLTTPGRWRGELTSVAGLPTDAPTVFDFNVQANPRLTDG